MGGGWLQRIGQGRARSLQGFGTTAQAAGRAVPRFTLVQNYFCAGNHYTSILPTAARIIHLDTEIR